MPRSILILFAAVLCLPGMLACANPADRVPSAEVSEATEAPAGADETAVKGGQIFEVGEGSTVSFIGSKITGSHNGGFRGLDGEITLVDADPTKSSVRLVIDTTTLWADNEKLTGHLKSPDFFDVETFPRATFTTTSIVPAEGGYTVTGNLDLHGMTKSISFPAQIEVGAEQVTVKAEFSIMRFDFGIVYPGKTDDLIRDEVVVKFDVVATPAG